MANVVIKFDSVRNETPQKKTNTSEVYVDVSLLSKYSRAVHHVGSTRALQTYDLLLNDNEILCVGKDNKTDSDIYLKLQTSLKVDPVILTFKVSRSTNIKAVLNALENIFNFFPGERILYPEFGSRLKMHLYNGITTFNVEQIVSEIYSNVEQFDKRIVIDDIAIVSTDEDTDDNTVVLRIVYHIDGLSSKHYTYDYSYVTGD